MKIKSISSIILLVIFSCVLMMNGDVFAKGNNEIIDNEIENSDWYSKAMKNIEESEYYIRYNDNTNSFQSPNRKNNLRFHYYNNGFTVEPRDSEAKWNIGIYLTSYGRDDLKAYTGGELIVDRNTGIVKNEYLSIEFINNNKGMRENFIVHKKINGEGLLELHLEINGNVEYEVNNNGIIFKKNDERVMEYKDLYVYDSNNKELKSTFKKTANGVKILVNDKDAVYPITIDPLSTTADWIGECDQSSARYGCSVSSAGDVNGDGYSDVIVGACYYDNGEADEGAAFMYYGGSSGLSSTADWIGEDNQIDDSYGISVSSAGDVNGDGYSDIIIGALYYSNGETNEGAAFVYYGSSSGLSDSADWIGESNQIDAYYGESVSSAGDVNGDGYSDILVGASYYDNGEVDEGAAFVYYGSSSGLSDSADWIGDSDQLGACYGKSVSSAGDVNGDGYSDVIVGAYLYDNGEVDEGAAFVYYGSISGLSDSADWIGESNQAYACLGNSVSSAGDVNGDGYSDIIIGSFLYDNGESDEGAAFVYYGGNTGLSLTADWMGESNQIDAYYGKSVSSAGDVNGDGYSDIIVGAYEYDHGENNEGAAFVYYGGSSGPSDSADWMGESNQASAYYGKSVSSAGDVNGDGYSDVIVGSFLYDNGQSNEGVAFVYYGGSSGPSDSADWIGESNQAVAYYGYSVSSAGDVNGDGYSDIIIGSFLYDNGQSNEGAAFVYYGSSSGLSITADWIRESNQTNARYGNSVSSAGDVNGDGYSDIIIGAYYYSNGETEEGAAFVYYGGNTGLSLTADWMGESNQIDAYYGKSVSSAGDVNGDGYSDVIVGAYLYDNGEVDEGAAFVYYGSISGLSDSADWIGESNQAYACLGNSVSSAGDVNGDGYSDIIIGSFLYDNGESDEGAAFVYYGGNTGLSLTADWIGESNQAYACLGNSVSSAGDVNGDGYSDIIVGAYYYSNGETEEGAAFVYYGSSSGLSIVADWIGDNNQANSQYGVNVSSAGDVNGDGYSDIIIGAYLYDNGEDSEGAAFVYYGSSSGLSLTADWIGESNQAYACLGNNVASAGDVNGDGYSDIIVGAYCYDNGESDEGAAFVYYGNEGGLSYKPIQMRNDETALIVAPLKSYSVDGFKIGLTGRNYMGIDNVKLEWEVKALGIPFDGTGLIESVSWYTTELNGINIIEQVDGLSNDTYYKWRVRIKYDMVKGILQPYSRWFYIADNAPGEIDVKTGVYTGIREKRVSIDKNNRLLDFSIYKDIKLLNREIQEKGLIIYTIDGRKLNRIIVVGQYCIVNEIDNKIINSDKIIVIK